MCGWKWELLRVDKLFVRGTEKMAIAVSILQKTVRREHAGGIHSPCPFSTQGHTQTVSVSPLERWPARYIPHVMNHVESVSVRSKYLHHLWGISSLLDWNASSWLPSWCVELPYLTFGERYCNDLRSEIIHWFNDTKIDLGIGITVSQVFCEKRG